MSESGSYRWTKIRSVTEVPVHIFTPITKEYMAALRSAVRYCREQLEAKLATLQEDFTADVKITLDGTISNFPESIHKSVLDKRAAFHQEVYARIDEKSTAIVQKIEYFKGEKACL